MVLHSLSSYMAGPTVSGPFITVQALSLQRLVVIIPTPCSSWGYWSPWFYTSTLKPQMRPDLPDDPLAIFSDDRKQRGAGRYPCQVSLDYNPNSGTRDLVHNVVQTFLCQVFWRCGVIPMTIVSTWGVYSTGISHGAILASGSYTNLG